jgi:predicted PhzF superfamily epimerase YddE/YHI9
VSFFFIPDGFNSLCIKVGVNEDPVSGWPHCALGPYFGARRGKQRLVGIQESDRTGLVECILKEDEQKVTIIGSTLTTVAGRLQMQA